MIFLISSDLWSSMFDLVCFFQSSGANKVHKTLLWSAIPTLFDLPPLVRSSEKPRKRKSPAKRQQGHVAPKRRKLSPLVSGHSSTATLSMSFHSYSRHPDDASLAGKLRASTFTSEDSCIAIFNTSQLLFCTIRCAVGVTRDSKHWYSHWH